MKLRLVLLSCVLAVAALAADVSGKWSWEQQGRNGAQTVTLTLKADGSTLTGTLAGGRGGDVEISDGKIDGSNVSFKVVREVQGNKFTTNYTGTVSGEEMKLKMETEGMPAGKGGPREVTAKKST
jgi:phage head maturation protease